MIDTALPATAAPLPPHNIELEQALLGAILIDNAVVFKIAGAVTADDFFDPVHAEIFAAAAAAIRDDRVATPITFKSVFADHPKINDHLSVQQYLGKLAANATTTANAHAYALGVAEHANRRRLCDLAFDIDQSARDPLQTVTEAASAAVSGLDDVLSHARRGKPTRVSLGDAMRDLMDDVANDDGSDRIKSGLTSLDTVTGGWRRKQFSILAGRPSMGKSAVATSAMLRTAKAGTGVLMLSLEMSAASLAARCLSDLSWSSTTQIPYSRAMSGQLTDRDIDIWARTTLQFDALPLTIDDQRGLTIAEISARVRAESQRMERAGVSLGLVIVDHLGLVKPSGRYAGNKVQEVGEVSDALATLAKSLNVSVLALHQLNRGVEGRENKRPTLSDLRDSGNLEQDADVVCFAYRESYYLERMKHDAGSQQELQRQTELDACRNTLEILISKNRNGPTTSVPMYCDMACNVIRDLAQPDRVMSRKDMAAGERE